MKRPLLFYFLIVLLIILVKNGNLFSAGPMPIEVIIGENDPCKEWFPDIDYNCHGSFLLDIEECDCVFIVEYCSRDLTHGGQNYQITGIYGQAHSGNNDCETCASRTEIYQEAYLYLLVNNPDGFYIEDQLMLIQQSPCVETIREDDDPMDNIQIELSPDN